MTVQDLMKRQVFTVTTEDPVDRVFFLLHYEKIRHLPVLDRGRVVGIVSDRDLYKAIGPRSRRRAVESSPDGTALYVLPRKVRHIMKRGVLTIAPGANAADAAAMMAQKKIGALPVVRGNRLVGIVTATDLLAAFGKYGADLGPD